jgi:hypothetical protein
MEQLVEWELAGETKAHKVNLRKCHVFHHKSLVSNPGRRIGKPATNRLR